jgi:hypothetical protein
MGHYYIRAGMLYLLLGGLLAAVELFDVWLGFNPYPVLLKEAILRALLLGWGVQTLMGLVVNRRPLSARNGMRCLALFNGGLALSLFCAPAATLWGGYITGAAAALGGLLLLLAVFLFVINGWDRA